ncbi:MAG: hypothetical protein JJLCMIEE_01601 [Acidimicrobiales bacterium]|nr:MAG: FtsX-like permease family protein [Actinomycetota bacterium]MBV6508537.1 hypothetical protein [Acidimicrobiales bacterium]RIK05148.1 MAG: hypothetical protein DCC48_11050 [Acidobacteriota bacterium]
MLRIALKSALAHKRRLITTGIAIVIGVTFMTGTLILSDTLGTAIDSLVSDAYDEYDAVIRSKEVQTLPFGGEIRATVPAEIEAAVSAVPEVKAAAGNVEGFAFVIGKDGEVLGSTGLGPPSLAFNWIDVPELQVGTLSEGRPPENDDEVVLDFRTAEKGGFRIGDTVTIESPNTGTYEFELVGLTGLGEAGDETTGSTISVYTLPTVWRVVGQPNKFQYISAVGTGGASQEEVVEAITPVLPPDLEAITGAAYVKEQQELFGQFVGLITTFILVFGIIAVFVGAFIIYNSFSIIIAQRTREMGLLRAVGAGRGQILGSVVIEAVLVGLAAGIVGLVSGIGIAFALKSLMGSFFTLPPGPPTITPDSVLVAILVGLLVTVVSALIPARRAAKITPIAAITEVEVDSSSLSRGRKVFGTALVVTGGLSLYLGLSDTLGNPLTAVGIGAACFFIAFAVLGPVIAAPMSRVLGKPLPALAGVSGRLARENAARNPKRTAATAAALTIGVALISVIAVMAASFKADIVDSTTNQMTADYVVSSGGSFFGFNPAISEEIAGLDSVGIASPLRYTGAQITTGIGMEVPEGDTDQPLSEQSGEPTAVDAPLEFLQGIDPETYFEVVDAGELVGDPGSLTDGKFALAEARAEEEGLEIGDKVEFYFVEGGRVELELALTYSEPLDPTTVYYLPLSSFEKYASPQFRNDFALLVTSAGGSTRAETKADVEEVVAVSPMAEVKDPADWGEEQAAMLNGLLGVIYLLLLLAVGVALIGIVNTLTLSIFERTRELGLLRAVGMSRAQLRTAVRWESVIMAVIGTLIGLVIGIGLALAITTALSLQDFLSGPSLPVVQLVVVSILAGLAGVAASIWPAGRAARLNVLDAIAME